MLHKIRNLSLGKKYLIVVILSVAIAIALLSFLVVRRETLLIRESYERDASIVTSVISKALTVNMLDGNPDETVHLLKNLADIEGVQEVAVLSPEGRYAFGMTGSLLSVRQDFINALNQGQEISYYMSDSWHFMSPLINEQSCMKCHDSKDRVRGIVYFRMSAEVMEQRTDDLLKRMSVFGIVTALVLSGVLSILSRRMLLLPLKGLTQAARRIAQGDFVLFRSRGTKCHEITGCSKVGCPSYEDNSRPCWLISGTLCVSDQPDRDCVTIEDCLECKVYKSLKGDELRELQDSFNVMSCALKMHEEKTRSHISEVENLNILLAKSNVRLETLLEASRHITSTLDIEQTLSTLLKIGMTVTDTKAGLVLLMQEDYSRRCHDYFACEAYNCPAYHSEVNCWRLAGTMCHSDSFNGLSTLTPPKYRAEKKSHTFCLPVMNFEEKIRACSSCNFFGNLVLVPRMSSGYSGGQVSDRHSTDSVILRKALLKGHVIVNYDKENPFNIPMETLVEIAMPLKIQDRIIGVLYLASDMPHDYSGDDLEFFQYLSEVISSGVFNSMLYEDMEVSYFQTVMALVNAVEAKDTYTRGHSERVADLCAGMADVLRLGRQERDDLRHAALLHDIGKIGISVGLLRKETPLEHEERKIFRSHPDRGVQILSPIHFLKPILSSIRHHHEWYDGSGYPLGLKYGDIPLKARIICVADAWDAMRSDRAYRDALGREEAKKELRKYAGTQFDPKVVQALLTVLEESGADNRGNSI